MCIYVYIYDEAIDRLLSVLSLFLNRCSYNNSIGGSSTNLQTIELHWRKYIALKEYTLKINRSITEPLSIIQCINTYMLTTVICNFDVLVTVGIQGVCSKCIRRWWQEYYTLYLTWFQCSYLPYWGTPSAPTPIMVFSARSSVCVVP